MARAKAVAAVGVMIPRQDESIHVFTEPVEVDFFIHEMRLKGCETWECSLEVMAKGRLPKGEIVRPLYSTDKNV